MSLFDEANADAYTIAPDQGAAGPQLGFQAAFSASWDLQTKVNSQLGMEHSFRAVEQAQMKRMRDAGLEPHKGLDDSDVGGGGPFSSSIFKQGRYNAAAQSIVDGGGWYTDEMVAERNAHIKREQELHPDLGLQTYDEMFKGLQDEATKAVARSNLPLTFGGELGSLAGGMAGAIRPDVNPINAATLPITGGGGVLGRMGVQAAAQVGAESADIALNDNRRLLTGEEPTALGNMKRIGLAAAGGAAFEGGATALGAGFRKLTTGKWFHDLPIDKGPPPKDVPPSSPMDALTPHAELMQPGRPIGDYPDFETFARAHGHEPPTPYGATREAALRHATDLDYATRELDKWDGPAPWELPPRTDTALPQGVEPGVRYDNPYQRYVDNLDTPADIARRMDPDLFRTYDALAAKVEELRATIDRVKTSPDLRPNAARPDVAAEHAAFVVSREQELRLELQQVDQRMRDLAPNVSRAMGAAENEWRHTPLDTATLTFLKGLEERTGWRYRKPPAQPADTVRLYRIEADVGKPGGRPDFANVPDYIRQGLQDSGHADATGRWFVSDQKMLDFYKADTPNHRVVYVDVPRAELDAFRVANAGEAKKFSLDPDNEFFVSRAMADTAQRVPPSLTAQPMKVAAVPPAVVPRTIADAVPQSVLSPERQAKQRPNADASDRIAINTTEDMAAVHEKVAAFVQTARPVLSKDRFELRAAVILAEEKLAAAAAKDAKRTGQALVVARKKPDGEIVVGEPGQIHAELLQDHDYVEFAKSGSDIEAQMGFATPSGEFLTRTQALEYVKANEPGSVPKRSGGGYGLEAKYYAEASPAGDKLGPSPATRAAQKELDALTGVTLPNGQRLEFNETVHGPDGNEISVRDYLAEMDKNQHALDAVTTCSRPS